MFGTLLRAFAYSKAPHTTYTVLHPGDAVRLRKLRWDMRHAEAPRLSALGAAALALPIGMWLGSMRARRARTNGHAFETYTETSGPMRAGERSGFEGQTAPRV